MNGIINKLSVNDPTPQLIFSWMDYSMFVLMLGISVSICIYYGFFAKKQNTVNEYLFAGRTMKIFPVSMSIIASDTSGIALLAIPADIYLYGAAFCWTCVSVVLNGIFCAYVFLPVFLNLQIGSIFEYLSLRFNDKIRKFASFLYIASVIIYNPMVVYIPCLAFAQATGINLYLTTSTISLICIFYTTIGGLKGVIWTDTLQTMSIAGSMAVVLLLGIFSAGGIPEIWTKSLEGHRLDVVNLEVDFIKRDGFWGIIIGPTIIAISYYTVNQSNAQRFRSVPSLKHAKRVVCISIIGIVIVKLVGVFTGLIIYAKYSECNPISTKQVTKPDQLLPFYVMDVAGKVPGLPGIFIAGIVSAGLSTLSTTLNSLSGILYDDFIFPFMPTNTTQKRASFILKLIVVSFGTINIFLVLVVEQLGAMVQLLASVTASTGAPLLGLFILGMLCPIANSKGTLTAGITGFMFCSWMVFGHQYYNRLGLLDRFDKPVSVEGCDFFVNSTIEKSLHAVEKPFILYRICFWYHCLIGVVVTVSIGLISSWITRTQDDPPVDRKLLSPAVHFLLPKNHSSPLTAEYCGVDKAMRLVTLNSEPQ